MVAIGRLSTRVPARTNLPFTYLISSDTTFNMLRGRVVFTDFYSNARVKFCRTSFEVTLSSLANILSSVSNDEIISLTFHLREFVLVLQSSSPSTSEQIRLALHESADTNS